MTHLLYCLFLRYNTSSNIKESFDCYIVDCLFFLRLSVFLYGYLLSVWLCLIVPYLSITSVLYGQVVLYFTETKQFKAYLLIFFSKRVIMSSEDDKDRSKYIMTLNKKLDLKLFEWVLGGYTQWFQSVLDRCMLFGAVQVAGILKYFFFPAPGKKAVPQHRVKLGIISFPRQIRFSIGLTERLPSI